MKRKIRFICFLLVTLLFEKRSMGVYDEREYIFEFNQTK